MITRESNDAACLVRIAGGDHIALLTLYDRYAPFLLALAQHIAGIGAEAEELVHDVFLDVWRHADSYQPQMGTVRAWLVLRTREHALEQLRTFPELAAHSEVPSFPRQDMLNSKRHENAENAFFGPERRATEQVITSMSPQVRAVLERAFFLGTTQGAIATELGLSDASVMSHLATVQHDLRQALHDVRRS